jgi:hypothetical protein
MLSKVSLLSSLLPIIFFIWCCRKTHLKGLWVIFLYSIASLLSDTLIMVSPWAHTHRYFMWNFYAFIEFFLLTYYFYLTFKDRKIRFSIVVIFMIYLILFFLWFKTINIEFNPILSFVSQVTILSLCLIYLSSRMKGGSTTILSFNPDFIIVVALLLYIASTLFLYVIAYRLSEDEIRKYWIINVLSSIITNCLYAASFYIYRFQNKNPPPENQVVDYTSPNDR